MKKLLGIVLPILMVALLITSCEKDSEVVTTEDYIDMEITDREGGVFGAPYGKNKCFKILFPFTIQLNDSVQVTAENRGQLHQIIKDWKASNPGSVERPKPVFPFTVKFRDGTTMEINGPDDLQAIRDTCRELFQDRPNHPRPHHTCFKIKYPIFIDFPESDIPVEVNSPGEFRQLLKEWRDNNEGSMERPEIMYPITVIMKRSGEEVVVNSVEELKDLHKNCR